MRGNVANLRDASGMTPCGGSWWDTVVAFNRNLNNTAVLNSPALYFGHSVDAGQGQSNRVDDPRLRPSADEITVTSYPIPEKMDAWSIYTRHKNRINPTSRVDFETVAKFGLLGIASVGVIAAAALPVMATVAVGAGVLGFTANVLEQTGELAFQS